MARSVADSEAQTPEEPVEPGRTESYQETSAVRRFVRRPTVSVVGLFGLLFLLCAPAVALHEQKSRPLFVLDEFAYADYLHKVHDGDLFARRGERTGQEALRELACRGYSPDIWPERPPCDSPSFNPADFPNAGINSADIHPPTYFVITDLGARAIMAVGLTDNLINAGRLFGAAWMAAGLCALWYLARALGASRWAAAVGLGLLAANPSLRWSWYYLTPDAANILVGSLVVLAALRWERSGRGLALLAGAGALAMAVKAPNIVVVAAVAAYLLARALVARATTKPELPNDEDLADDAADRTPAPESLGPRPYLGAAAALLAGAGAAAVGWLVLRSVLAIPGVESPMAQMLSRDGIGVRDIAENVGRFITVWDLTEAKSYPLALITSYVLLGSLLAALVVYDWRQRNHTLALVTGATVIVGPLLLVAMTFLTTGSYFLIEPRYGATLIPAEVAIAACLWRGRAALFSAGALAVTFNLAVLVLVLRR